MPRTKIESLVFTAITAWIMVYIMTLYNKILVTKHFLNSISKGHPLIHVLRTGVGMLMDTMKEMWIEYIIIFLCAFFISSHIAKYFAFKIVKPDDRLIYIILIIQVFTVIVQVAFASILGIYHGSGFNEQFIPNYIVTYCKNFMMALPVQLFIAGPIARRIFGVIFAKSNQGIG
ncbi:DUF2798 domain-containing protein [Luxibacter massiliensis]|uniref:DUF2798 domain-containing protein n=1 Tax=Luxibacter massiliensis TaxID=2219695 RepID=UPI000F051F08|nr:DUF2798 domain-containing protein [Luxibacter massiliensis]